MRGDTASVATAACRFQRHNFTGLLPLYCLVSSSPPGARSAHVALRVVGGGNAGGEHCGHCREPPDGRIRHLAAYRPFPPHNRTKVLAARLPGSVGSWMLG